MRGYWLAFLAVIVTLLFVLGGATVEIVLISFIAGTAVGAFVGCFVTWGMTR